MKEFDLLISRIKNNETHTTYIDYGTLQSFSKEKWQDFFLALKDNKSISNFSLNHLVIPEFVFAMLADYLKNNQKIKKVSITACDLDKKIADIIFELLHESIESIELWLLKTPIRFRKVKKFLSLKELAFGSVEVFDEDSKIFNEIIEINSNHLIKLILENLKNESCLNFDFTKLKSIVNLDCSKNIINLNVAKAIGEYLKINKTLESLVLEDCQINDESLRLILSGLDNNKSLKKLWLNKNLITDAGANMLAKLLETNDFLEDINLNFNQIHPEAIEILLNSINKQIKFLGLKGNKFNKNVAKLYENKMGKNFL